MTKSQEKQKSRGVESSTPRDFVRYAILFCKKEVSYNKDAEDNAVDAERLEIVLADVSGKKLYRNERHDIRREHRDRKDYPFAG